MSSSWNYPTRASPSYESSEPSQAELGPQQVQVDLSYATSYKKLYQRYKAYG